VVHLPSHLSLQKPAGKVNFILNLPGEKKRETVEFRNRELVEDALKRAANVKTAPHELGNSIKSIDGIKSDWYHFFILDKKTGKKGIPFAPMGGKKLYLDLRNMQLTPEMDGMTIELTVVSSCGDFGNSVKHRVDAAFSNFLLDELQDVSARADRATRQMQQFYPDITAGYLLQKLALESQLPKNRLVDRYLEKLHAPIKQQHYPEFYCAPPGSSVASQSDFRLAGPAEEAVSVVSPTEFPVSEPAIASETPSFFGMPLQEGAVSLAALAQNKPRQNMAQKTSADRQQKSTYLSSEARPRQPAKPLPLVSLKKIKAVIFDLDGVAVDSEEAHFQTHNQALAPYGAQIDRKVWGRLYGGVGSPTVIADAFRRNGINADISACVQRRAEIYQEYLEKNGSIAMEGFLEFQRMLEENRVKTIIASGGHRQHIATALSSIGVPSMKFVGLEDVKRPKPAPEIFLLAAKRLGAKPSECIVFEDALAGFEAASRAGMPCIALSTTLQKKEIRGKAALIVRNFKSPALRKLCARLLRRR
jgi:beta-phosphoglucomutase-like phosphatase (HAD superfamily)